MRVPPPVVALSPGDLDRAGAGAFVAAAREARAGGLAGLVLREPALDDAPLLELARTMRRLFEPGGAFLAVHDRLHVALASEADGCHLGWRSLDDATAIDALARAGRTLTLSRSTHAGDDPALSRACGWLVHGPLADVPGKTHPPPRVSLDAFADFVAHSPLPVWALGGVDVALVASVRAAGASGVAVRRAIWRDACGPRAASAALVRAWEERR